MCCAVLCCAVRMGALLPGSSIAVSLLQVDLSKRYGCLVSGVNDIKSHPWLRSIDWSALRGGKLEPPIR